jgi:RNA recognition motif-containing protein
LYNIRAFETSLHPIGDFDKHKMGDSDGTKIFVYGVSADIPRDLLEDKFEKFGRVKEIFNSGKGYAFITMDDERDAKAAIEELNGQTIDGQEVKVELSKPRSGGGGGGGRDRDRGYGGGGRDRRGGGGGGYGGGRDRDGGRGGDRYGGGGGGRRDDRGGGRDGGGGRSGGGGGGRRDDHDDRSGGRDRDRSYNRRDD